MIGIIFIVLLLIWGLIALGLSKLLWKVISSFKKQPHLESENQGSSWQASKITLLQLLLAVFIFFLPIADEIVAYPHYYQMCQSAGKYEFAVGMDAKKAFGREYFIKFEDEKLISLFPWFHELSQEETKPKTALVKEIKLRLVDENTDETILKSMIVVPVRSLFAIPWDGKRITWLLHSCTTENKESNALLTDLRLKQVYKFE